MLAVSSGAPCKVLCTLAQMGFLAMQSRYGSSPSTAMLALHNRRTFAIVRGLKLAMRVVVVGPAHGGLCRFRTLLLSAMQLMNDL